MRTLTKALLGAAALAVLAGASAHAQVVVDLTPTGGWSVFDFLGGPPIDPPGLDLSFQDLDGNDITYDFTLTSPGKFYVTDGYFDGDQFDVTINGVDQGPTSTPALDGTFVGDAWWTALRNPDFSSAVYDLGPGVYSVTGIVLVSPYGNGAGAVNLTVPEPAAWTMMLLGVGAIGVATRRRRSVAAA